MEEIRKQKMQRVLETLKTLQREKQEYFLGYAEGLRDMAKRLELSPEPPEEKKAG